jgi:hypothetical protein
MSVPKRLLILISAVALSSCCSTNNNHNAIMRSKSSAVVLVHAVSAMADQDTVTVSARNGRAANGQPIPSQILWTADEPIATLKIVFVDPLQQCVRGLHCEGSECHAVTNVQSSGARCEYRVSTNGTEAKDPVVVIEDCCP